MWKLLRGTIKHSIATPLEWGCDKLDYILRAAQLRLYDLMDVASNLHMDAHDDLEIHDYYEKDDN